MPNIVYVLTNRAMPGIVKIGMTDRDDVKLRMAELYSTGVPLPFECAAALEVADQQASRVEDALHAAFGPHRINASREFFRIDPDQAEALLEILPGRDVTPRIGEQAPGLETEDLEAMSRYNRTNELEFLDSFNENGRALYERVLAIGNRRGMQLRWGKAGFSLNVATRRRLVAICFGYPPSASNRSSLYTGFYYIRKNSSVRPEEIESLREEALDTGLFIPIGKADDLAWRTDQELDGGQMDTLIGWLERVVATVLNCESAEAEIS